MTNIATSVNMENYERALKKLVGSLTELKAFNLLTIVDGKQLRYCCREIRGRVFSKNGQASISLKPGRSIAWDLNTEMVELEYGISGTDITLTRTFKTGRKKIMTITQNPI